MKIDIPIETVHMVQQIDYLTRNVENVRSVSGHIKRIEEIERLLNSVGDIVSTIILRESNIQNRRLNST